MEIQFSETAFAFAATKEVEQLLESTGHKLLGAPDFPTLRRERNVGYDVKIDATNIALILQFKLGEFISREHRGSNTWRHAGGKHFRTKFPAGHHQLALLQELESRLSNSRKPYFIGYLAPGFREQAEFNEHYLDRTVVEHSYGCRPSQIPDDGNSHHLVFVPDVPPMVSRQFVLSEPVNVNRVNVREYLGSLADRVRREREVRRFERVGEVSSAVSEVIAILTEKFRASNSEIEMEALRHFSYEGFEERPNLGEMYFAINLGLVLGVSIGFTVESRN
ncbi:hypothetical protein ATK23_0119 [Glutamicibacter mysorens]|uniref:NERD domain-containing protein n=1 Tax=Glutamicibacter mysorens TaxID=257984 RepID=A0ABX4MZ81_9MICC|nr:hypothetical protein [Glutamicibacter mysorens]PJJ42957.1 hypothetical protein ATK23_0119 [Glutamicibacter mysorens]